MGFAQQRQQLLVVGRAGAAAIAFQQQRFHAAVEQPAQVRGAQPWIERQHGEVHFPARLAVAERRRHRRMLGVARSRQFGEGVERVAAQFADSRAVQQGIVEIDLYAARVALLEDAQGADQVVPGIAARRAGRQHGAGQQHRDRQVEEQEGQRRGAVGQGVGAVQEQHAVVAGVERGDDGVAHRQPVALGHVGAVQRRLQFGEAPAQVRGVAEALQVVAHARFEATGRSQSLRGLQHADGAAGVEHEEVLDWEHP
ncbi:Uncharacterised protein [Acinetobacter baumannii]|nr:Uncharacterised protein [Acinetobacter baumannii]